MKSSAGHRLCQQTDMRRDEAVIRGRAEVWEPRGKEEEEGGRGTGEGMREERVETGTSSVSGSWSWRPSCPGTQGSVAMLCLLPRRHGHRVLAMSGQGWGKEGCHDLVATSGCWCAMKNTLVTWKH